MTPLPAHDHSNKSKPFHVHITGFGPFGEHTINPSWQAVKQLHQTTLDSRPAPLAASSSRSKSSITATSPPSSNGSSSTRPIHFTSTLIPVTYASSLSIVPQLHTTSTGPKPDLIIHVGVGAPYSLTLEALARKFSYDKPDVDQTYAPLDHETGYRGFTGLGEVFDRSDEVLHSSIDVDKVLRASRGEGGGIEFLRISKDAGLFLCEFTFCASLAWAKFLATTHSNDVGTARRDVDRDIPNEKRQETPVQFIHVPPVGLPYSLPELTQALRIIIWAIVNEGGLSFYSAVD
ncbi:hypothetical protein MVLG_00256 [Microbotryum lychnidis-dioicae p1A1 Lamole]|uniref:Pyroglutamyl-peptidase I n=1 Tax=Microbotryum lychnidis-dioicae (strain p1A1 Lamole / MvSl-1064) TaxID=683840 RepID=U5GYI9_USTV1|nr:hypothetical protein MVLG_00256 [Microbotryum lychnidis-dioicae p1A1 Lamole]|eukprot:KDE09858.1 hypothetical protein MVLG_00256 [Microbotryum lychnidis-dioicae p1A1 Lamole]